MLVAPVQVMMVSMFVTVGSVAPPGSGSSVLMVAKLLPDTEPCVLTDLTSGGEFTVAEYLMVTLLPIGSVPMTIGPIVSPDCGVTPFFCGAIAFALLLFALRVDALFSAVSVAGFTRASLLLRKFNFAAKAAT